jgi:imidazolonepropionase-like amidohydrolase
MCQARTRVAWVVLPMLLATSTRGVAATAPDLALVGGTVITATGQPPIANAVVLVQEGRITAVGPQGEVKVPPSMRTIDVRGKWITPGLIDTNVHLILMTVPEFFVKYEDRFVDIAIQSAQVGLKYGMTTMADTWGPLKPLLVARDRINRGEVEASRVLVAGNIIGAGGPFSAYFMAGWDIRGVDLRYGGWVHPMIRERIDALWEDDAGPSLLAMTPEEAGEALGKYMAKGVDFVKVAVSGHGLGEVEPLMFSPAALRAMRDEARKRGIPFTTHTFTVESLRMAVEVGAELLQHPNVMSVSWQKSSPAQKAVIEGLIADIARKGIYCGLMAVPDKNKDRITREWNASEHPDDRYLNRVMKDRQREGTDRSQMAAFEDRVAGLRKWIDGGVRFTIATDQGPEAAELGPVAWGRLGRSHFERMEALQDAGVSPIEILIAATRNGAEAYGLGNKVGTVEVGKVADLLVLDADPLKDVHNLRKINQVIKDGRLVDRSSLPTTRVLDYDPEAAWPK